MVKQNKKYKIGTQNYMTKIIHKDLNKVIQEVRKQLQQQENAKFKKKACPISTVYASKLLAKKIRGVKL